jgi:predicted phage-related endonuclease
MYYLTQCLGYLSLTGWDRWHLGVLIGGNEFRSYTIESSAKANKILEEKLALFWQRVEHRNPPEPITSGDVDKLYPSACIASIDIANQVEELREVRATMKGLMSQKEELEIDIKKFMKTTDVLLDPEHGKPMITWAGSAIKNLNKTAVEKELGDRLSEFQKTTTTRRFVVK